MGSPVLAHANSYAFKLEAPLCGLESFPKLTNYFLWACRGTFAPGSFHFETSLHLKLLKIWRPPNQKIVAPVFPIFPLSHPQSPRVRLPWVSYSHGFPCLSPPSPGSQPQPPFPSKPKVTTPSHGFLGSSWETPLQAPAHTSHPLRGSAARGSARLQHVEPVKGIRMPTRDSLGAEAAVSGIEFQTHGNPRKCRAHHPSSCAKRLAMNHWPTNKKQKQTNKQTYKQAKKQSNKRRSKQTSKQTSKETIKQTKKQAIKQRNNQTNEESSKQTNKTKKRSKKNTEETHDQATKQHRQTDKHTDRHRQPDRQANKQTDGQTNNRNRHKQKHNQTNKNSKATTYHKK